MIKYYDESGLKIFLVKIQNRFGKHCGILVHLPHLLHGGNNSILADGYSEDRITYVHT